MVRAFPLLLLGLGRSQGGRRFDFVMTARTQDQGRRFDRQPTCRRLDRRKRDGRASAATLATSSAFNTVKPPSTQSTCSTTKEAARKPFARLDGGQSPSHRSGSPGPEKSPEAGASDARRGGRAPPRLAAHGPTLFIPLCLSLARPLRSVGQFRNQTDIERREGGKNAAACRDQGA